MTNALSGRYWDPSRRLPSRLRCRDDPSWNRLPARKVRLAPSCQAIPGERDQRPAREGAESVAHFRLQPAAARIRELRALGRSGEFAFHIWFTPLSELPWDEAIASERPRRSAPRSSRTVPPIPHSPDTPRPGGPRASGRSARPAGGWGSHSGFRCPSRDRSRSRRRPRRCGLPPQ